MKNYTFIFTLYFTVITHCAQQNIVEHMSSTKKLIMNNLQRAQNLLNENELLFKFYNESHQWLCHQSTPNKKEITNTTNFKSNPELNNFEKNKDFVDHSNLIQDIQQIIFNLKNKINSLRFSPQSIIFLQEETNKINDCINKTIPLLLESALQPQQPPLPNKINKKKVRTNIAKKLTIINGKKTNV